MISSLNASDQQFLNNLGVVQQRLSTDELQLSSGLKMAQVSDDPDQVSTLLQARASLATSQQVSTNLGLVTTEVNGGEQALETAVTQFDQIQTLSAEASTSTQTAASRATIAQQLQSIEQQMVGLANTNVGGRYIFAGDADQTQPYTYDAANADPVSAYQGSASTRVIAGPDGQTFPVALTAQQIFDSTTPADNVFTSINSMITALQNNDSTAIQTANAGLSQVGDYLNQQLSFYGTTQDTLSSATNDALNQQTQIQTQISGLQDADSASVILDMTSAQTQETAALTAQAQMPRQTLFDYLG
jgi:flagellar hook-associated protein 3 FlgL